MANVSASSLGEKLGPLRVGIIGLGRRWQKRYLPVVKDLPDRFQISAVCDQVQERAVVESRRLGCVAATGPLQLVERHDTDAVLLLEPQWYRLWPIEAACRWGKPVFCADTLERDDGHADALHRQVMERGLPVLMALPYRFMPAAARLRQLLGGHRTLPRQVLCTRIGPISGSRREPSCPSQGDIMPCSLALLDWCASLFATAPSHILAACQPGGELATVLLRYRDGQAVQITRCVGPSNVRSIGLRVLTEQGIAAARLPHHVRWSDRHGQVLPCGRGGKPVEQVLLEHFHECVTQGRPLLTDLGHAYRLLGWWRLAARSLHDGRWHEVPAAAR
jgi:predicted dehydrogenase